MIPYLSHELVTALTETLAFASKYKGQGKLIPESARAVGPAMTLNRSPPLSESTSTRSKVASTNT